MAYFVRVPTLRPGRYLVTDVAGRTRWVEYTAADVRRLVANGNAQLAAGLSQPLCWMHDPHARPEAVNLSAGPRAGSPHAWLARGWFGGVRRWEEDPATGEAVAVVRIEDAADYRQFKRVRRVSPGLKTGYVDERGVAWPGLTCLHIASTPTPVQRDLTPVSDAPAFPAQFLSHPAAAGAVWLSHDSNIMGGEMAKDTEAVGGDDAKKIGEIVELLREQGLHIQGEPQTLDDLYAHLQTAIATKKGGLAKDEPEPKEEVPPGPEHAEAPGPALMMSADPRVAAVLAREVRIQAKEYEGDVETLAREHRIDQATKTRLLADMAQVNLSADPVSHYDAAGRFIKPPFAYEIEAYAKLPKGRFSQDAVEASNASAVLLSHTPVTIPEAAVAAPAAKPAEAAAAPAAKPLSDWDRLLMARNGLTEQEYRARTGI